MKLKRMATALLAVLAVVFTSAAIAQPRIELGKREYMSKCAVCHGTTGKGDGSYFELLKTRVPDITTISERNNRVFPVDRVYQMIDGRDMPKAHGTREMPIWGRDYSIEEAKYYADSPYEPGVYVRVRILSLIDYIYSLQNVR